MLVLLRRAYWFVDRQLVTSQVGRPPQGEIDHADAHRRMGVAIDQNEATRLPECPVRVEGNLPIETDVAVGDVVELKRPGGNVFQTLHVELVFEGRDLGLHHVCANLQQIGALGQ